MGGQDRDAAKPLLWNLRKAFQVLPRRWVVERTLGLDHPGTAAPPATTSG